MKKIKIYFTPVILRTKEESEHFYRFHKGCYFLIVDFSQAKEFRILIIKIFHQYRPLIHSRVSRYDTDINLLFDIIHITFNYSLR